MASLIALDVAEGSRRLGRDRVNRFRIAAGSADEVRAQLRVAIGWGYLTGEIVIEPMALVDRELRLLWGLMHKRS